MARNITMKLIQEEHNKTTFEYTLRTPFYQINIQKIIDDINEIEGIYSVEKG